MKTVIVILILTSFVVAQDDNARSTLSKVNVDEILNNERILVSYLKCLQDEGPCTAEGRVLKKQMLEFQKRAIVCEVCNDKEKETLKKALTKTKQLQSERYEALLKKYANSKRLTDAVEKFLSQK